MSVRILDGAMICLAVLLLVLAVYLTTKPKPAPSFPSRLEKSCPAGPFFVPCFTKDEALSQTWDI